MRGLPVLEIILWPLRLIWPLELTLCKGKRQSINHALHQFPQKIPNSLYLSHMHTLAPNQSTGRTECTGWSVSYLFWYWVPTCSQRTVPKEQENTKGRRFLKYVCKYSYIVINVHSFLCFGAICSKSSIQGRKPGSCAGMWGKYLIKMEMEESVHLTLEFARTYASGLRWELWDCL